MSTEPTKMPGIPILRKRSNIPVLGEQSGQLGDRRVTTDAQAMVKEIHEVGVAIWSQLRDVSYSLEAIASPYALPHIPCVAPLQTEDGEPAGFGVFCFACSYGGENRNSPELLYCQRDDVDLSVWPPQRLVGAPEFTESDVAPEESS